LRFLGFEDEAAEDVVIFLVFDKFKGVDSSSGLKSSSSSSSSYSICCGWGFCAVRSMLGSLALRLKFPIFKAEPICAGVPLSISNAILLDAIGAALCPKILGCLGRRLKLPIDIIEVFFLPTLVSPLSCARFDSTLLDRARAAARPRMLG
jgi:hypothetical protein